MAQGGGGARAGPGILVSGAPNRVRGRCVCAVALHLQKALPTSLEQTHSRRFQGLILCCFRMWSNPVCAHTTEMIPLGSTGGLLQDSKEAARLHRVGADRGDIIACANLAAALFRGNGVVGDVDAAQVR